MSRGPHSSSSLSRLFHLFFPFRSPLVVKNAVVLCFISHSQTIYAVVHLQALILFAFVLFLTALFLAHCFNLFTHWCDVFLLHLLFHFNRVFFSFFHPLHEKEENRGERDSKRKQMKGMLVVYIEWFSIEANKCRGNEERTQNRSRRALEWQFSRLAITKRNAWHNTSQHFTRHQDGFHIPWQRFRSTPSN
jgi:hypothetical protein